MIYFADTDDICLSVKPVEMWNNFLRAGDSVQLTVIVLPVTNININRRRHVYLKSTHPSIVYEIPIIVAPVTSAAASLPLSIDFPSTWPKTPTYYESIFINKTAENVSYSVKT